MGLPSVCLHALSTSKQNVAVAVTLQCVLGSSVTVYEGVYSKTTYKTHVPTVENNLDCMYMYISKEISLMK